MELYTAPLEGRSGRLQAATGRQRSGVAIDEGVFGAAWPVHEAASRAGNSMQVRAVGLPLLH